MGGLGLSFAPFDNSAPDKHGPKLKTYDFLTRVDDQAAAIAFLASRRAGTALRAGIFNDISRLGPFR